MKNIFGFFATLILGMVIFNQAQASIIFGNDTFKFTGDTYLDVSSDPTQTFGLGRISTITEGGSTIWSSGDGGEYINFVFGDYQPVVAPVAPIYNFQATGGYVNFYLSNSAATFNTLLDFATVAANIMAGDLFLSTVAVGDTIGIGTPTTYSANGFLDITGGLYAAQLNTNSRPIFVPGTFADLSFGLSGSNNQNPLVNSQYSYIVSADVQGSGQGVNIPEPEPTLLLGTALLGLGFMRTRLS